MNAPMLTSGTTGKGKPYRLTPEQEAYRQERKLRYRPKAWGSLKSLYIGFGPQTPIARRQAKWATTQGMGVFFPYPTRRETIAELRACKVEGAYAAPADLLNLASLEGDFRFRCAITTGAMLMPEQCRYIREHLCEDVNTSFGCSETGVLAYGDAAMIESEPGCVGRLCDDVEAKIDGGLLYVRGPSVIEQYADGEPATVAGWFKTGDRAHFTNDGMLVLDGRI